MKLLMCWQAKSNFKKTWMPDIWKVSGTVAYQLRENIKYSRWFWEGYKNNSCSVPKINYNNGLFFLWTVTFRKRSVNLNLLAGLRQDTTDYAIFNTINITINLCFIYLLLLVLRFFFSIGHFSRIYKYQETRIYANFYLLLLLLFFIYYFIT